MIDTRPLPRSELDKDAIRQSMRGAVDAFFEAIKRAPPTRRSKFPVVLQTSNFDHRINVHGKLVLVDVLSKRGTKGQRSPRSESYDLIFGPIQPIFILASRFITMGGGRYEGSNIFDVEEGTSACIWDASGVSSLSGGSKFEIELMFILSPGPSLPQESLALEFETLSKVAVQRWSTRP